MTLGVIVDFPYTHQVVLLPEYVENMTEEYMSKLIEVEEPSDIDHFSSIKKFDKVKYFILKTKNKNNDSAKNRK